MGFASCQSFVATLVVVISVTAGCASNHITSAPVKASPLNLPTDTRILVLLFHGRDRGGDPVWNDLAKRFEGLLGNRPGVAVVNYDWSAGSDMPQRAAPNAAVYGATLAEELARAEDLTHIHLVAHSAGSYVLNELCPSYREKALSPAHIEMTFLDPFGNFAVGQSDGNGRAYGACADYASAYVNTDDRVPTTNTFLPDAYNFDVTQSALRGEFAMEGHDWPVRYFLRVVGPDQSDLGGRDHKNLPRGQTVIVE